MEAIKCPICGSEKVKDITEDKYICLACDNVFMIHNLSKEFKATDEHLTEVHKDIKQKLDEIARKSDENGNDVKMREYLLEAEEELAHGDNLEAYTRFKKYAAIASDSSIGYEGMFRALTGDYADNAGEYINVESKSIQEIFGQLHSGFDVLKMALECKDCDRVKLLSNALAFYKRSAESLVAKVITGQTDIAQNKIRSFIEEGLEEQRQKINQVEDERKTEERKIQEYEKLSILHLFRKAFFSILPCLIVTAVFLLFRNRFMRIIIAVLLFIVVINCICSSKNRIIFFEILKRIGISKADGWKKCVMDSALEKIQNNADWGIQTAQESMDKLQEGIGMLDKIEALDDSDMEHMICSEWNKGTSAERLYQVYLENRQRAEQRMQGEQRRKEELMEGFFQIEVVDWGQQPSQVKEILISNCSSSKYVKEKYKNRDTCKIAGFKKAAAYELQQKLISCGAIVYVRQM